MSKLEVPFQQNHLEKGEYRIYLDLTAIGEQAFEILQFAATLGFDKPEFATDRGRVFAILFREFHQYEDNAETISASLDEKTADLWEACEPNAHLKLTISHRFAEYLEGIAA